MRDPSYISLPPSTLTSMWDRHFLLHPVDGSSPRRISVKFYPVLTQRRFLIGAVSPIHGDSDSSFQSTSRVSFAYAQNLVLRGGFSGLSALKALCQVFAKMPVLLPSNLYLP
ncbi:unnamed protein product [Brassica rapa subsp. narinosa]